MQRNNHIYSVAPASTVMCSPKVDATRPKMIGNGVPLRKISVYSVPITYGRKYHPVLVS